MSNQMILILYLSLLMFLILYPFVLMFPILLLLLLMLSIPNMYHHYPLQKTQQSFQSPVFLASLFLTLYQFCVVSAPRLLLVVVSLVEKLKFVTGIRSLFIIFTIFTCSFCSWNSPALSEVALCAISQAEPSVIFRLRFIT